MNHDVRHILAATDLSPCSLQAMDRGFQLARATGARYTVMSALGLDALGPLKMLLGDKADDVTDRAMAHQRAALEAVVKDPRHNPGVDADVVVEDGLAATVVPARVASSGADLVLVGAKGGNPVRSFFLGSTASHLMHKSASPVLVVKKPCKGPYQRALLPVDFSPASAWAVRLVRNLVPSAQIVLLNVFDVPFEGVLQYAGVSEDEIHRYRAEARERAIRDLHALATKVGLSRDHYVPVVEHGNAAAHILDNEKRAACDLIVMGKHGTHVTEELLLGSVTKHVLSESHGDVLVVVDKRAA